MIYRAKLSHSVLADSYGEGATDHDAIEAAFAANPAYRHISTYEFTVTVWQVYGNAKNCVMNCWYGKYVELTK